jgi:hypothetical protein
VKISFALLAVSLAPIIAVGQTAPRTSSPEDSRAALRAMLCGDQGMPPTSTEIPTIGCFDVQSGGSARGLFDAHQFEVTVDTGGQPKCRFAGAAADCNGCVGLQVRECPVRLMVVSRNADKSVSFSVQRNVGGNRYVFRIGAWDRYLEERQTDQETTAAQARATPPAPASGTLTIAPAPLQSAPPLPPGTLPGSAETDGPAALSSVGFRAQGAYAAGRFAILDQLIETLSQPDKLTDDGMPQALGISQGLWDFLTAWNDWPSELRKIGEWRREYPDSYGADLVEAILWRAWAWHVRGDGYASSVTPEGWKLFNEKLAHSDEILVRCKSRAAKSPLWYQLRLAIARDSSWDAKRYQALFNEAVKQFPWYVPFYLSAENYLSPKWGGTYEQVDELARRTTATRPGKDFSLCTHIYWDLTDQAPQDFDPFRDSYAAWPLMKKGFEGLMKRYPKSKWNLNAYAAFACRANDGTTYGALRVRIGQDVIQGAWPSNYSSEVCDKRLLGGA